MNSPKIVDTYSVCTKCDHEWRPKKTKRCPNCECSVSTRYVLEAPQTEALMRMVNENSYGTNSEDEITFVISEMSNSLSFVSVALIAQACWIYLNEQPSTPQMKTGMRYFKTVFTDFVSHM